MPRIAMLTNLYPPVMGPLPCRPRAKVKPQRVGAHLAPAACWGTLSRGPSEAPGFFAAAAPGVRAADG